MSVSLKGKRVTISTTIDENGFDNNSIDISNCDTDRSMNSDHFVQWRERTAFGPPKKFGRSRRIFIFVDNATWHNELTGSTKPAKPWRQDQVQTSLREHNIDFNIDLKKGELLQLAFDNMPRKEYKVNLKNKMFSVEILRLSVKHCSLNTIELGW